MMNHRIWILTGVLLFCLLCAAPVAAITVKHIDITVAENGDADITADYTMNWMEQAVVYPAALPLATAAAGDHAVIHSISPNRAQLTAKNFVSVLHTNGSTVYSTPAFSSGDAQRQLDRFWFANLVTLDLTSGTLTVRFPDGATGDYTGLSSVPSFMHTVSVP